MKGTTNFLAGIILGFLLGAAAALLYAPKSGTEFRADLQVQVTAERQRLQEFYEHRLSQMQAQVDRVREDAAQDFEQPDVAAENDSPNAQDIT